jgi:hypothetical protein
MKHMKQSDTKVSQSAFDETTWKTNECKDLVSILTRQLALVKRQMSEPAELVVDEDEDALLIGLQMVDALAKHFVPELFADELEHFKMP